MKHAFRALLVMCAFALSAYATPSMAKPRHHSIHAHGHQQTSSVRHYSKHRSVRAARRAGRRSVSSRRALRGVAQQRVAQEAPERSASLFGDVQSSSVVNEARRWIGTNPTNRSSLWCGTFMNFVLQRTGHGGTGSDLARSFASYGQRVSGPRVGAIAVMSRRGGGHVGVVSGFDAKGNPIIISGNHGRKVAESVYQRGRIYAYVMPGGGHS